MLSLLISRNIFQWKWYDLFSRIYFLRKNFRKPYLLLTRTISRNIFGLEWILIFPLLILKFTFPKLWKKIFFYITFLCIFSFFLSSNTELTCLLRILFFSVFTFEYVNATHWYSILNTQIRKFKDNNTRRITDLDTSKENVSVWRQNELHICNRQKAKYVRLATDNNIWFLVNNAFLMKIVSIWRKSNTTNSIAYPI